MSIKVMSQVWEHSSLKGTERLTLVALADCANDEGEAWPSLATIAKKVNCTIPRVCKLISDIEQTGELRRQRSSGGFNKRTRYKITVTKNSVTGDTVVGNTVAGGNKILPQVTDAINGHRTINNSAYAKRTRRTAPPDPRTNTLLAAFGEKFLAVVGSPYPAEHGRDKGQFKKLLDANYDVPAIEAAMDSYFASEFYGRQGRDVPKFCRAFAAIISTGTKRRHNYEETGMYPA